MLNLNQTIQGSLKEGDYTVTIKSVTEVTATAKTKEHVALTMVTTAGREITSRMYNQIGIEITFNGIKDQLYLPTVTASIGDIITKGKTNPFTIYVVKQEQYTNIKFREPVVEDNTDTDTSNF